MTEPLPPSGRTWTAGWIVRSGRLHGAVAGRRSRDGDEERPCCTRSQIGCREGETMRSTRIRLAASAALAALASPRRRKALFILAVAGLLAIVAGCSGGSGAAKNDSLEPSQDVFARAGGWIAFRERLQDRGRRPGKPEGHPRARALPTTTTQSHGRRMGRSSSFAHEPSSDGGLFVRHPDGSRTTVLPTRAPYPRS